MIEQDDAIKCGFVDEAALLMANGLTGIQQRMLAAMALAWFNSKWTDKARDLHRGIQCVLNDDGKWND